MKPKVCLVSSGWIPLPPDKGGAVENYVCNVVKYCRKLGIDAIAIDSQINKKNKVEKSEIRFEGDNIPVIRLPVSTLETIRVIPKLKNRRWIFREFLFGKTVAKKLSKFIDYDLIHINNAWVGFAFALFKENSKFVYTCHNPLWPEDSVHLGEKVIRLVEGYAMKRCSRVIALNKTMAKSIQDKAKIDARKIVEIPNGVDTDFFRPDIEGEDILKKFGLEKMRYLLFVGRISFVKGVHGLIEAFKSIKNRGFKLAIVGPFSERFGEETPSQYARWLIDHARRELGDRVVFTGAVSREELRILYSNAYCLVLPSISEAFGMVLIEAMASGLPVIGSNAGGIPDVVDDEVGYVFEKSNWLDLSRKIEEIIFNEGLRNNLAKKARKRAVEKYSWFNIASELKKLYLDVLKD